MKTSALPNIIREGNTPQLLTVIQGGKSHGMQTMDEALETLVRAARFARRTLISAQSDKAHFEKLLNAPLMRCDHDCTVRFEPSRDASSTGYDSGTPSLWDPVRWAP